MYLLSNYSLTEMMIFPFWRWPATMKMLTRDKALINQQRTKRKKNHHQIVLQSRQLMQRPDWNGRNFLGNIPTLHWGRFVPKVTRRYYLVDMYLDFDSRPVRGMVLKFPTSDNEGLKNREITDDKLRFCLNVDLASYKTGALCRLCAARFLGSPFLSSSSFTIRSTRRFDGGLLRSH